MKRLKNGWIGILAAAALLAACSGSGGPQAELAEATGTVRVNDAAAQVGAKLNAGDRVEVAKDACAKIRYLQEGYELYLYWDAEGGGNGRCVIEAPRDGGKTFVANLANGLLTFFVPPKPGPRSAALAIDAGDTVLSIHQTQGKVFYNGIKYEAALKEGLISIRRRNEEYKVKAGEQLTWNLKTGAAPSVGKYDFMAESEMKYYFGGETAKPRAVINGQGY